MATKTITIMEDAYTILRANKLKNESFSDVIRRTLKKKRDIIEFAGAWAHIKDEEIEKMKKDIEEHDLKETKKLLKKYEE